MYYALLALFALAAAGLDQLTKWLAAKYLVGQTLVLVPGWLQLHYLTNDGMALSMFRGGRWVFVVLTAAYLGLVIWAIFKRYIYKKPELWCIAAVTGGAIGNLIDRIATGLVIDMICVPWFSTFNVADIFITVGAAVLVVYVLFWDKEFLETKPKEQKPADPAQKPEDSHDA